MLVPTNTSAGRLALHLGGGQRRSFAESRSGLTDKIWRGDLLRENDPQQVDAIKNWDYHTKNDNYDFQSASHER